MVPMSTRREVLQALFFAAIGGVLPGPLPGGNHAWASEGDGERHDFEPARKLILEAIQQGSATGVAVAVVHHGRIVWEEGFGWANRESGVKASAHTPFTLASITKPFTATTLMTLAAEGRLSLDDPANKYLGDSRIVGTNGNADGASVRLLGSHASGLPVMYEGFDQEEARFAPSPNVLLRNYGRLAYAPGSCYEYSNIGFAGLAAIASSLTGAEIGTLMTQRVLSPLGLDDSFFDTSAARLATGAARYDSADKPIPYYTTATPASGELYASAHDLARFAIFNMKHRLRDQAQILNDRWIDELHKPVFIGPSGVATTFGWFLGHLRSGAPVIFKYGGQPGVATVLSMLPSENLACLVLTNRSDGRELCNRVGNQVLGSYLPEWQQQEETSGAAPTAFDLSPTFAGRWQGTLANDSAAMRVSLEIQPPNSGSLALNARPAEKIVDMQSEGAAITGVSTGLIDSPDARRTGANTLKIKLMAQNGKLVGRALATGGNPDIHNVMLPYVLTLNRMSS